MQHSMLNTVMVITAYSCMISSALNHASFSSNFSEPKKNPAEESQQGFAGTRARATVSHAFEKSLRL